MFACIVVRRVAQLPVFVSVHHQATCSLVANGPVCYGGGHNEISIEPDNACFADAISRAFVNATNNNQHGMFVNA